MIATTPASYRGFRPVYLHFLNRELRRNANASLSREQLELLVRVCLLVFPGRLVSSAALFLESEIAMPPLPQWLSSILVSQELSLISEFASVERYLDSVQAMYSHDRERYPMYFGGDPPVNFSPTIIKASSTTADIDARLRAVLDHQADDLRLVGGEDLYRLVHNLPLLERVLDVRSGRAFTLSLFNSETKDTEAAQSISRLISQLHLSLYIDFSSTELLTGVPGLAWLDPLSVSYPTRDFHWSIRLLKAAGCDADALKSTTAALTFERRSLAHLEISRILSRLVGAIFYVGFKPGMFLKERLKHPSLVDARNRIVLPLIGRTSEKLPNHPVRRGQGVLDELASRISQLAVMMQIDSAELRAALAENEGDPNDNSLRVVLVVASEAEQRCVMRVAQLFSKTSAQPVYLRYHTALHFGSVGGVQVIMVRTSQAVNSPGAATLTVVDVIDQLRPTYIILIGTAYGLKEEEQSLADVLVATQVRVIDHRKLTEAKELVRGDYPGVSVTLRDRFEVTALSAASYRSHFGPMLTSSTLVNRKKYRLALKASHPDAIGGEMEAAGLYSAAGKRNVEWIVVKGISDLGFEKDDAVQVAAASNAADLVFRMIASGSLALRPA